MTRAHAWELVSERPGGSVACLCVGVDDVLALSTAAVHRSVDGGTSWSTFGAGQPAAPLYSLARGQRSVFVGGANGLFRTRDGGHSWRHVLSGAAVTSIAVAADQSLLAGTDADGVLRSDDDGESWASGNPGLLDLNVLSLAAGFVGTASGLYRSVNHGRSWRQVQLPCEPVAVECVSASGRTVVVGTDAAGAFISTDTGLTWSAVPVREAAITAVAVDGAQVAIAGPAGVYVSRDSGQTWCHEACPEVVLCLAFVDGNLLAGVAREGVLRLDGGPRRSSGLHGRVILDLACTPRGTLLTAGIDDGVQQSTDGGRTWDTVVETSATRLAVGSERVYAATAEGVYASADDGCHWSVVHSDAAATCVAACGRVALAAFEDDRLMLGRDGAWTARAWERSRGRILTLGVAATGDLFVGSLAERPVVWRSSDAAQSWSPWLRCTGGSSLCLAIGEQVLVGAASSVHRLLGSTSLPDPVTSIAFGAPHHVYVGTTRGVYTSTDGAEHFTFWSDGLPGVPVLALHVSASTVYALVFGGGLWRRALQAAAAMAS